MSRALELLATTSKGTEALLRDELEGLGVKRVKLDRGGVRFRTTLDEALYVCVHSRIAMRVLLPLVDKVQAPGADGLYEAARNVPWEEHLDERTTFAVEATLRDSEHNHSGFVALKIKDAIVDRMREATGRRPDVDTRAPMMRVVAHLAKQVLSLSLDLAGEPLHRRGYRRESVVAPMKETLAAAVLRAAKYDGTVPFADPMCGSGTLAVEAGLIATNRAPGLHRDFAVTEWPALGQRARTILTEVKAQARSAMRKAPSTLLARDRDEAAVEATRKNVRAAGLEGVIRVELADALTAEAPEGPPGLVVSNPPYGDRLSAGGQKGMKTFYYQLSQSLERWHGWRTWMLCANEAFESAFHRRPHTRLPLWNGPLECQLRGYAASP